MFQRKKTFFRIHQAEAYLIWTINITFVIWYFINEIFDYVWNASTNKCFGWYQTSDIFLRKNYLVLINYIAASSKCLNNLFMLQYLFTLNINLKVIHHIIFHVHKKLKVVFKSNTTTFFLPNKTWYFSSGYNNIIILCLKY